MGDRDFDPNAAADYWHGGRIRPVCQCATNRVIQVQPPRETRPILRRRYYNLQ